MITELVCPEFYVDEWLREGRCFTYAVDTEFEYAADDGVCRIKETTRDDFGVLFICRCGVKFRAADAKQIEVM